MSIKIPIFFLNSLKFFGIYELSKKFYRKHFLYSGFIKNNIENILFYKSANLKNGLFLDVGCYKGSKIDNFLNIDKKRPIIGLEPFLKYFEYLNKKYKKFPNVKILNMAANDKNNVKNIFYYNTSTLDKEAFSLIKNKRLNKYKYVNCCKIDDFINLKPSIIKIDTEGAELKVLDGSIKTLNKFRPIFFIEVTNRTFKETLKKFKNKNYFIYVYEYNFFKKKLFNNWEKKNLIQNNVYEKKIYSVEEIMSFKFKNFMFNIVCIPKESIQSFRDLIFD